MFSLPYLPNIAWFQHVLQYKKIVISGGEHYVKQTYRNRCHILNTNGVQTLIIPVKYSNTQKTPYNQLQPDNSVKWQQQHWNSLVAAYGKSAFFFHYRHFFEPYYDKTIENVFYFNLGLLKLILKLLKAEVEIEVTDYYIDNVNANVDFRNKFNPKKSRVEELLFQKKYHQVFAEKFSFESNLSIVDLLFNRGTETIDFLVG